MGTDCGSIAVILSTPWGTGRGVDNQDTTDTPDVAGNALREEALEDVSEVLPRDRGGRFRGGCGCVAETMEENRCIEACFGATTENLVSSTVF